jgi:hypothetical protein
VTTKIYLDSLVREDVAKELLAVSYDETIEIVYSNGRYDGALAHKAATLANSAARMLGYNVKVLKKSGKVLVTKEEKK